MFRSRFFLPAHLFLSLALGSACEPIRIGSAGLGAKNNDPNEANSSLDASALVAEMDASSAESAATTLTDNGDSLPGVVDDGDASATAVTDDADTTLPESDDSSTSPSNDTSAPRSDTDDDSTTVSSESDGDTSTSDTSASDVSDTLTSDTITSGSDDPSDAGTVTNTCPLSALQLGGRVLSPEGAAIAGVSVTLTGTTAREATTDADGYYNVAELCPGSYRITPSTPGLSFCTPNADVEIRSHSLTEDFTGSPGGCDANVIERRVLVLVYDPLVPVEQGQWPKLSAALGFEDPISQLSRVKRALEVASNGHVRFVASISPVLEPAPEVPRIVDGFPLQLDGFRYTMDEYLACVADETNCHAFEAANLLEIEQTRLLCEDIDGALADDLWMIGGPHFGFAPWAPYVSECRRSTEVLGLSYGGDLAELLAAFQARSEGALRQTFGVSPEGAPNPFDAFTQALPSNCEAWGCTELGYRRYWLSHLPKAEGRDSNGKFNDFWRYIVSPDDRNAVESISCSSSNGNGWCNHVLDHQFGTCNENEWATAEEATGWVDLYLAGRTVSSVHLYDRACPERVLRGHVEFPDGAASIEFGALDGSGTTATVVGFPERPLTSLRVFIDESEGGVNPGFGEIMVF